MDEQLSDILIIGAGMAGLSCAVALAQAGHSARLLDKGRGPGGRMAARRTEVAGQTSSFDHGAQYFTARDSGFQAAVAAWEALGAAARWPAAGDDAWVGVPGMNGPIRAMAESLDVRWNVRAVSLSHSGGTWQIEAGEQAFAAQTLLVAVPSEQASELLADVAPDFAAIAASAPSQPCWAVMAGFEQRLNFDWDVMRHPEAAISWAARNSAKPQRGGAECWVLHASPARSREIIDLPKEEAAAVLLSDFFAQMGAAPAAPIHLDAHRWLYALPAAAGGEPAHFNPQTRIGIAGDYLHSPRVEGAWLSGLALARKVLSAQG